MKLTTSTMGTGRRHCIAALQSAADQCGESPTKAQYEELGATPSSGTIVRTFGSWNLAKEAANLETYPSSGSRTIPKPDDVEVPLDTQWTDLTVDQRWYYRNAKADNAYELERRSRLRNLITQWKRESQGVGGVMSRLLIGWTSTIRNRTRRKWR